MDVVEGTWMAVLYVVYQIGMKIVVPVIMTAAFVLWITNPPRPAILIPVVDRGITHLVPRNRIFSREPSPLLTMAITAIIFACYFLGEMYGPG